MLFMGGFDNAFAQSDPEQVNKASGVITSSLMKKYIGFLASDDLLGRNTGSPGNDTAAAYIARTFKKEGISPVNNSYFQYFDFCKTDLADGSSMTITKNEQATGIPITTGFVPFDITGSGSVAGDIVFAGYGITAPELNYDDYAGIDARGKIVLIFRHVPRQNDKDSPFGNVNQNPLASLTNKMKNAVKHGAIGMMVVTEPNNYLSIKPRGFPWPYLNKNLPVEALPSRLIYPGETSIPVIHVGDSVVNLLFGTVDTLKNIQTAIDQDLKPKSFFIPGIRAEISVMLNKTTEHTQNVVGFIEGSDPVLKNEIVVVGAHYDHVGYKKTHKEGEDYIFNGADDNASGTSGTLAVAKAIQSMNHKPGRSILFLLFSGEEKGLWGSDIYVNSPLLPLEKTVAMLNMDMIGRNSIDSLDLEGADLSPDITGIVENANSAVGFYLSKTSAELGGSDHYNFYKKGIPFMFFFAGLHPDYHKVTDNPDRINYEKAAKVAQLALRTALIIANEDKHYKVIKK
jgi:hypothetical protein